MTGTRWFMSELTEAKRLLRSDGEKLQVLLAIVNPERDTPDLLKACMANFDPSFLVLRCTAEELKASQEKQQPVAPWIIQLESTSTTRRADYDFLQGTVLRLSCLPEMLRRCCNHIDRMERRPGR